MPDHRRGLLLVLGALALVAASCGSQEPSLPPSPTVVNVSLRDYRFDYKAPAGSGRVVFHVQNAGKLRHELVLLVLPEDLPPLQEQLRSKQRRAVATLAFLKPLRPGERGIFAVDLKHGRYGMACFVRGSDGVPYSRKGMASEFRIR